MSDNKDDSAFSFEALSVLTDGEANEREVARACGAWRDSPEARAQWHAYQVLGDVMRSDHLAQGQSTDADFVARLRERLAQEPVVLAPAAMAEADLAKSGASTAGAAPALLDAIPLGLHAKRRPWAGPMSVAAGFVLVVGALVSAINGGALLPSTEPAGVTQTLADGQGQGQQSLPALALSGADMPVSAGLPQGLSSALAADQATVQKTSTQRPSFNEKAREGAGNRVGYVVLMRDDQLDQLLAAQRERAEARSLASPSGVAGMVMPVSIGAAEH